MFVLFWYLWTDMPHKVLCTLQILGWVLLGVGLQWGGCQELVNYPPPLCGGFTLKFPSKLLLKSLLVRLQTKMLV